MMRHLQLAYDDTGQEYRLDLAGAGGEVREVAFFTAADDEAAAALAAAQLTAWGAGGDEAGDLYTNDGAGCEVYLDTVYPAEEADR
jgi:hypothetical protein